MAAPPPPSAPDRREPLREQPGLVVRDQLVLVAWPRAVGLPDPRPRS
jgi:hypothetical protein